MRDRKCWGRERGMTGTKPCWDWELILGLVGQRLKPLYRAPAFQTEPVKDIFILFLVIIFWASLFKCLHWFFVSGIEKKSIFSCKVDQLKPHTNCKNKVPWEDLVEAHNKKKSKTAFKNCSLIKGVTSPTEGTLTCITTCSLYT